MTVWPPAAVGTGGTSIGGEFCGDWLLFAVAGSCGPEKATSICPVAGAGLEGSTTRCGSRNGLPSV
jgi:hypothetical protein